jgi:hypothetical protein
MSVTVDGKNSVHLANPLSSDYYLLYNNYRDGQLTLRSLETNPVRTRLVYCSQLCFIGYQSFGCAQAIIMRQVTMKYSPLISSRGRCVVFEADGVYIMGAEDVVWRNGVSWKVLDSSWWL